MQGDKTGEGKDEDMKQDDKSRDSEEEKGKRVEGKDRGEGCNSLLSPSPAPSPNLPRTINQIRRQTLIEDYHATGSTTHTHTHTHTHRERWRTCMQQDLFTHTYFYAD